MLLKFIWQNPLHQPLKSYSWIPIVILKGQEKGIMKFGIVP